MPPPANAPAAAEVLIRPATSEDLPAVSAIDGLVRGRTRSEQWLEHLRPYLGLTANPKDNQLFQVAVAEDRVVGFVLGDLRGDDFDLPRCGWIVGLGVDPPYRGQKVGQALVARLIAYVGSRGISTIRTMVAWDNAELLSFFGSLGFDCGPLLPLEKQIATASGEAGGKEQ
ncbi:MAG: GNAT family N-acetyltransferase [Chloroflexota bacterium]